MIRDRMKNSKSNTPVADDRPILVSQKEIEKRCYINGDTLASFAVDNPDTRHIFKDFVEGKITKNE